MLIEQAFFNLPEILVGAGYAKQDYEAGIVSAFSLAILQELNGRNAPNPISFLCAEKRFLGKNSKLRADIHVKLGKLYSGSRDYSEFGFRFSNWIEAKFFRLGTGIPPSTQNLGSVVADLFRLVALVPIERGKGKDGVASDLTITGRYFLHAYRGDPMKHLNPKRRRAGAGKRKWVRKLLLPGTRVIQGFELAEESDTFFDHLGSTLKTATCRLTVTNYILAPSNPADKHYYTVVLSRLEAAEFTFKGRRFTFSTDRKVSCIPAGEFEQLREDVAKALKAKKGSEKEADDVADDEPDEDQAPANQAPPAPAPLLPVQA
jgi:hypothetical protein